MRLDKLVGERFKQRPADCVIDSHALMLRGGYMKNMANGIYSSYTVLRRITQKIENIVRQEMDAVDGQEVLFPVVMPASIWQESGRYYSIGSEMLRFEDRNGAPMVLGMTHEEAAVHLVREYGQSYAKYPFMIYQIQTKFRDEARPRGGLIRVREFTMKDAYSFHTSQEDLEEYYKRCYHAYERIFARVGVPEVVAIESDSGMMGGSLSHEFMLLTPIGEDTIVTCPACGYKANMEAAQCVVKNGEQPPEPLKKTHTPGQKTIEEVCAFLNAPVQSACKAVAYQLNSDGRYCVVFIRGDLDVNETKLTNLLGCGVHGGNGGNVLLRKAQRGQHPQVEHVLLHVVFLPGDAHAGRKTHQAGQHHHAQRYDAEQRDHAAQVVLHFPQDVFTITFQHSSHHSISCTGTGCSLT